MNKKLIMMALLPLAMLTACDTKVEYPNAGGVASTSTVPYAPTTTSTTYATPDFEGNYCWTETNPQSPDGVESFCDKTLDHVNLDYFLHFGKSNIQDGPRCWTVEEGICNIRQATDDVQTTTGNWVPRSFYEENLRTMQHPEDAGKTYQVDKKIDEDSKWWRCSLDGNKICGS